MVAMKRNLDINWIDRNVNLFLGHTTHAEYVLTQSEPTKANIARPTLVPRVGLKLIDFPPLYKVTVWVEESRFSGHNALYIASHLHSDNMHRAALTLLLVCALATAAPAPGMMGGGKGRVRGKNQHILIIPVMQGGGMMGYGGGMSMGYGMGGGGGGLVVSGYGGSYGGSLGGYGKR
ncbi:uncharacterized protein LOC125046881 [Penaeus chinensis]|uniref:uncharacterized protein LOC125046881 n=1 Tax=Penaeus chinensis TaxID=139456 RepID=UPI001FB6A99F|nr:uncharacterized protein LOC125046881 [Penaeus chinensis]